MRTTIGLALVGLLGGHSVQPARADSHKGPHDGIVVKWGEEEYHPEIVVDKKTGTVTVYVYGTHDDLHKKKLKAIDSESLTLVVKTSPATTVKLMPGVVRDHPKGWSTKFTAKHDVFTKDMKWAGTISGKVGNKPYSGDFEQK